MQKKKFYILAVVLVIFLLSFTLIGCTNTKPVTLTDEQKAFYSNWMTYIEDETPINRIAILGSHDSGTYDLKSIIKGLTITQDLSIGKQLEYGCRYFDIRVNKKKNGDLNIFHDIDTSGGDFLTIANDIVNFMSTHPSEFLVLDFQHFKNGSQSAVIEALKTSKVTNFAICNNTDATDIDFISNLTLGDMRGKVIIIWGSNEAYSDDYPFLFRRNNDSCSIENSVLDSLYSGEDNKKKSDKFIAETLPKYMAHISEKEKGLTVLQGQLTAKGLKNLKNLENSHNENMSKYVRNISSNTTHLNKINIVMRDFIGSDLEKTNSVLALNIQKGNVKNQNLDSFADMVK